MIGVPVPAVRSLAEALPVEDGAANNPHTRFRFYHQLECKIADVAFDVGARRSVDVPEGLWQAVARFEGRELS